jgi:L-methionine (R)-S-oxide reductase
MKSTSTYHQLTQAVRDICIAQGTRDDKLLKICHLLKDNIHYYHWVGFYITDPETARELVLGPYVGAPTEHTRIPFGKGICGQAAETERTFIIQDVSQETNYLSCSPDVVAEIVVPIFVDGHVVGELDIDSHHLEPFTEDDRFLLDDVCAVVAELFTPN